MRRVFVWPSKNWRSGASDHPPPKKTGITRPRPDGGVKSPNRTKTDKMNPKKTNKQTKNRMPLEISSSSCYYNRDRQEAGSFAEK